MAAECGWLPTARSLNARGGSERIGRDIEHLHYRGQEQGRSQRLKPSQPSFSVLIRAVEMVREHREAVKQCLKSRTPNRAQL